MSKYDPIRETFSGYKVPIDTEKLWAETSHAIPKKRNRRILFFWLFGIIGAGSAWMMASYLYPGSTGQSTAAPIAATLNNSTATANNNLSRSETVSSTDNTNHLSEKSVDGNTSTNATQDEKSLEAKSHPDSINTAANNQTNHRKGKSTISHTETATTTNSNSINISNKNQIVTSSSSLAKDVLPSLLTQSPTMDEMSTGYDAIPASQSPLIPIASDAFSPHQSIQLPVSRPEGHITTSLESMIDPVLKNEFTAPSISTIPARKTTASHPFAISLMQSVGIMTIDHHTTQPEHDASAAKLNQSIEGLEFLSTHVSGEYRLLPALHVNFGGRWSHTTSQVTHFATDYISSTTNGTTSVIIDDHGNVTSVTGPVNTTRRITRKLVRYNYYNAIDITAGMRFRLLQAKRLSIHMDGQVGYTTWHSSTGHHINEAQQFLHYAAVENALRPTSNFNFSGGLLLQYKISPHWSVLMAGSYRDFELSHAVYQHQITSRYRTIPLGIGVRYQR